ncbi:MAG TPA: thiamine-phosphate kinase [Blastocatellia bacterium]|nr:thiamine-phosphate kinase [Blastocatellia bacterium]
MPGELEIISKIRARSRRGVNVVAGIGDDAAVLRSPRGKDLLACCDLSIEGVHFRTDWMPPELIGRKALAVNLSDIAAMGGVPLYAMMSIALSGPTTDYIDQLFTGVLELAEHVGVSIIGGDTSSSPGSIFIDVSVIGECEQGQAVLRNGARPGDFIFLTGTLGASALGLKLLQAGKRLERVGDDAAPSGEQVRSAIQRAIGRHLRPEARLKAGHLIGQHALATAMIDISDGLSTDLFHVLEESNCGAVLNAESIPIDLAVMALASASCPDRLLEIQDALEIALHSGEEYELLFTVSPDRRWEVEKLAPNLGVPISLVGEIVEGAEVRIERNGKSSVLRPLGYEHKI